MSVAAFFVLMSFTFPPGTETETGPAFIPRIYGGLLFALGFALAAKSLRGRGEAAAEAGRLSVKNVVIGLALFTAYVIMIPILGFYLMTLIMVAALLRLGRGRSPVLLIAVPAGVALFIYLFFEKLMSVPMPSMFFLS